MRAVFVHGATGVEEGRDVAPTRASEAAQPPAAARPSFIHPAIDFVSVIRFLLPFIFSPPASLRSALCAGATNNEAGEHAASGQTQTYAKWMKLITWRLSVQEAHETGKRTGSRVEAGSDSRTGTKRAGVKDAPVKNLRTSPMAHCVKSRRRTCTRARTR